MTAMTSLAAHQIVRLLLPCFHEILHVNSLRNLFQWFSPAFSKLFGAVCLGLLYYVGFKRLAMLSVS